MLMLAAICSLCSTEVSKKCNITKKNMLILVEWISYVVGNLLLARRILTKINSSLLVLGMQSIEQKLTLGYLVFLWHILQYEKYWQQLQDIADRVPVFGQRHLFCSQHISVQLTDIHITDHKSVSPIKCCVRLTWTLKISPTHRMST